ncbi:MAG: hypothetical protein ACK452_12705 [Bacteroidota bacterium]|jgi:hypothetical protein
MLNKTIHKYFSTIVLVFNVVISFAQPSTQTFNPFSRYGLGEIENKGYTQIIGAGRSFSAFENDDRDSLNPAFINAGNPASYTSLRLTVFEVGGKSDFLFFKSNDQKEYRNVSYLNYISLGFPIGKRTGVVIGVSPFSSVGYKISDTNIVNGVGKVASIYEGSGGLNQVYFGAGFKPFATSYSNFMKSHLFGNLRAEGNWKAIRKKRFFKSILSSFSMGANAYFVFGDLNNKVSVVYPSGNYFNTRRTRNTRISDYYFNFGALISIKIDSTQNKRACEIKDNSSAGYHIEYRNDCPCKDSMPQLDYNSTFPKKLRKYRNLKITLGATAYFPTNLSAEYNALGYSYKTFTSTIDFPYDTTLNIQRAGEITMPLITSFGFGIRKGTRLNILGDISIQNWSYYRFFGENPGLKNSFRASLGFQLSGSGEVKRARELSRKKMMIRGGIFYNSGYLELKNTRLNEFGLSAGIGLPMGRWIWHHANISIEAGKMGTTSNNLIQSNFVRLYLGLTLNQKWFIRRVID